MHSRSIIVKLWLSFTLLILVVLVPLELGLHRVMTGFFADQVTEPLLYHSHQLAHMLAADPTVIREAAMVGQMVGGEVMVLDAAGNPLPFPGSADLPVPEAAATALAGAPFAAQVTAGGEDDFIVTGVPIPDRGGAVLLLAPAQPLQHSLTVARRYLWLAGGGTLLLGTILALALSRHLLRPVIAIERATRSIAQGDFSTRVEAPTGDEIGRLAAAVNHMTAQLQAYEDRRREFLANVAHELRTPLSYIRGYTQAMSAGLVHTPEDRDRYQRIVHEEAVRLGRLVDDLMDIAQMDEGALELSPVPLDLVLPVEQAVATIRPLAEEKGVAIEVDLPPDLPHPPADGGRIQQVIFNLLDNGLRHTPPGGRLRIAAAREGNGVMVRVADTGPGVDPEMLPLVFQRFHKRGGTGRGLGLAVVRSIVRAHGGQVGAENAPGSGAVFWFSLPLSAGSLPAHG